MDFSKFRKRVVFPILAVGSILLNHAALADDQAPDFEIQSCSRDEMLKAELKYMSASDAVKLCVRAREAMDFPLMAADMRNLIASASVIAMTMAKRGEILSPDDALMQIVDIVKIRGLTDSHDGFRRTVDLVYRIAYGSEGRVPPATLLKELRSSGPLAKTMSDAGITNLAAMISVQKRKGLSTVPADNEEDFSDTVGNWEISGKLSRGGHLVMCRMQRDAEGDSPTFSYAVAIASGDGKMISKIFFFFQSPVSETANPQVLIKFDGKNPITLKAGVQDGIIHAELPDDITKMKKTLDIFSHSKQLTASVIVRGKSVEHVKVDLEDTDEAFDRNGQCMKEMTDRAVAMMKQAN